MISLGCRGLGIIFNLDLNSQQKLFNFGAHLGIAFQVHDDILDFTQDSAMLGKPAFNDVKEGIITAPLIYALLDLRSQGRIEEFRALNRMILSKFSNKEQDVPEGVRLLFDSCGIELADQLSIEHIEAGLESLLDLEYPDGLKMVSEEEKFTQGLVGLALKVKTRKY